MGKIWQKEDAPEEIIRRNVFYILGQLYPHAVISRRPAFELKPTDGGDVFLTYGLVGIY